MTAQYERRVLTAALCLGVLLAWAGAVVHRARADNGEGPGHARQIPDAKRKEIVKAVIANRPAGHEVLEIKLKAAESAKIDRSIKANKYPEDPAEPPVFFSQLSKTIHITELKTALDKAKAEAARYTDNPLSFAPPLKGLDKGEIGWVNNEFPKVEEVIDPKNVVLVLNPASSQKRRVLLTNVDTSNLADGKRYPLAGVYYVAGNAKWGTATVMELTPFVPTTEESKQVLAPVAPKR